MIERLPAPAPHQLDALTRLWESPARATHDFLAPEDIVFFREYLVTHRGFRRVDANELNAQAAGFYARLGFRIVSRDALDPSGRPYPILHLQR